MVYRRERNHRGCYYYIKIVFSVSGLLFIFKKLLLTFQGYLWDDNKAVAFWLEQQLKTGDTGESIIANIMKSVQRDAVISQIKSVLEV